MPVVPIWVSIIGALGRAGLEIYACNEDEEVAKMAMKTIETLDIINKVASCIPIPKEP